MVATLTERHILGKHFRSRCIEVAGVAMNMQLEHSVAANRALGADFEESHGLHEPLRLSGEFR